MLSADECDFQKKTNRATDKLLVRLRQYHDFNLPKPPPKKPEPLKVVAPPGFAAARLKEIQRAVASYYSITILDLVSTRKPMKVVHARQIAYYLCRTLTTWSLPSIGKMFGGRDHTTIMYGVQKIDHLMPRRFDVAYDVAHLIMSLGGEPE